MLKRQKLHTKQCIIGQIIPYTDSAGYFGGYTIGRSLFRINRGTDDDDRMGRTIMVKEVELNVQYYNDHLTDYTGDEVVLFELWLDTQPQNSAGENTLPTYDDIYAEPAVQNIWNPLPFPGAEVTTTFNSQYTLAFQNPTNEQRFKLLKTHQVTFRAPAFQPMTAPIPEVAWPVTYQFNWKLEDMNLPVTYQYNSVALSDYVVKTNSLFIVSKTTADIADDEPRLRLQCKVVYTDGT